MITKFRLFENEDSFDYTGRYLKLKILKNGNLKIVLTPDGKEEIADNPNFNIFSFSELFDDIRASSDLLYIEDISGFDLGVLSEAPAITDGYYYDDDGEFTDYDNIENSEIFYYPNYNIKDFTKELYENGFVIFVTNGKNTPEEVEEIKNKREINKYNL